MSSVSQFPPVHLIPDEEGEKVQDSSNQPNQPLSLPAPSSHETEPQNNNDGSIAKFDTLGPMVVNSDGTLSRIHNWQSMTEAERERTARLVNQRNQARLKVLRERELADSQNADEVETSK